MGTVRVTPTAPLDWSVNVVNGCVQMSIWLWLLSWMKGLDIESIACKFKKSLKLQSCSTCAVPHLQSVVTRNETLSDDALCLPMNFCPSLVFLKGFLLACYLSFKPWLVSPHEQS